MNQLKHAYFVLGLPAGSPLSKCLERYKQLVMIWHPDRLPKDHPMRESASQELKRINNARDILQDHFLRHHSDTGFCACRSDDQLNYDSSNAPDDMRHQANSTQNQGRQSAPNAHTSSGSAQPNASSRGERADQCAGSSASSGSSNRGPTQAEIRFRWRCIRIVAVVIFLLYALALMIQDSRASRQPIVPISSNVFQSAPPNVVAPGPSPDGGDTCSALNGAQLGRSPFPGNTPGLP